MSPSLSSYNWAGITEILLFVPVESSAFAVAKEFNILPVIINLAPREQKVLATTTVFQCRISIFYPGAVSWDRLLSPHKITFIIIYSLLQICKWFFGQKPYGPILPGLSQFSKSKCRLYCNIAPICVKYFLMSLICFSKWHC